MRQAGRDVSVQSKGLRTMIEKFGLQEECFEWICRGVIAGQATELRLVGVQLFFDEGFDDRPQNLVRDLLHHVGTHFLQDPRDQGFYV